MRACTIWTIILAASLAAAQPPSPLRLRVEYLEDPIAIDEPAPRFSWALQHPRRAEVQAAYRVTVVEAPSSSAVVGAALWDSDWVASNRTLNVPYGGAALSDDTDYRWTVEWRDSSGSESPQAMGHFSTAILAPGGNSAGLPGWRGAEWVSSPNNGSLRVYRTEFTLPGVVARARLYVATLGYGKTFANGNATDPHELGQHGTWSQRVTYRCVDVGPLLRSGANVLGVMLGSGWFSRDSIWAGPPQFMLLLSLTTADGHTTYLPSAVSGPPGGQALVFTASASPASTSDFARGEVFDGRVAAQIQGWTLPGFKPAQPWTAPLAPMVGPGTWNAALSAQTLQITTDRDYPAVSVTEPRPGTFVFDFGQNMAGQATLTLPAGSCPAGTVIAMQHAEILHKDGTVDDSFCERPKQWLCEVVLRSTHVASGSPGLPPGAAAPNCHLTPHAHQIREYANYTCAGSAFPEVYRVAFASMGFRYIQITGHPGKPGIEALTAHFIHAEVPQSGAFSSSSDLLQSIQHATRYSAMSNMMDIPTDCPQRERRGWLGDAQVAFDTLVANFDVSAFYAKFLRQMGDAQAANNMSGALPDYAPADGQVSIEADPGWGIAAWAIPSAYAAYYDDHRAEAAWYPKAKAYMDHWVSLAQAAGGVLPASLCKFGDWGEWTYNGPSPSYKPPEYSQFFYITALDHQASWHPSPADMASRVGLPADQAHYSSLAASARALYLQQFYNATTGYHSHHSRLILPPASTLSHIYMCLGTHTLCRCYSNCSDVSQIFGLTLNLHPDGSPEQHSAWARALGWFGPSGAHPSRFGAGILAYKLVHPLLDRFGSSDLGLAFQLHTDSPPSLGYWVSQGATTLWEYWGNTATTFNSGLNSAPGSRSWAKLVFAPPFGALLDTLTSASASIDTPMGLVSCSWLHTRGGVYSLNVTLPPNSMADVKIPMLGEPSSNSVVEEGGHFVWSDGKFVPGVAGITAGSVVNGYVVLNIGSGSFCLTAYSARV
eukprot:gene4305-783_t